MIYTDGNKIVADTHLELMAFARKMKMSASWFRDKGEWGYFEIFGNNRKSIMRDLSADGGKTMKYITAAELIEKSKTVYGTNS